MVIPRIFQFFDLFTDHSKQNVMSSSENTGAGTIRRSDKPETFVERRHTPDRRQLERRKVNCHPYLDTRANNGRRRSFGRRATDEKVGNAM